MASSFSAVPLFVYFYYPIPYQEPTYIPPICIAITSLIPEEEAVPSPKSSHPSSPSVHISFPNWCIHVCFSASLAPPFCFHLPSYFFQLGPSCPFRRVLFLVRMMFHLAGRCALIVAGESPSWAVHAGRDEGCGYIIERKAGCGEREWGWDIASAAARSFML